jgi:hypothetical protein
MGPQLKQKLRTKYPEWHHKPLRLNLDELMHPHKVFAEFFDMYNLPAVRACLRQWLEDAFRAEDVAATDHFYTCNHVEKLVEAAWLLRKEVEEKTTTTYNEEEEDSIVEEDDELYGEQQTIYRNLPFFDRIQLRSFCQVILEQGTSESLHMEGPEEILRAIDIEVDEKQTLIIKSPPGAASEKIADVTVFVTYAELTLLATCSTGSIRTANTIREATLQLVQNGTGNLIIEAETGSLQVIIHGAGNVQAGGTSFHTHLITYGPGNFEGSQWQTRAATVFLGGAGNVSLNVAKRLEGSVGGNGRLQYAGTPVFKALQLTEGAAVVHVDAPERKN